MEEIPNKAKEIQDKICDASVNTDLNTREFLAINKALLTIKPELVYHTSKLTEINNRIDLDTKQLEEVQNDPSYSNEQKELYRNRLDKCNIEKQASLEILSQNRKDLQTQVVRIKSTLEKVLDKDTSLAERIRTLFR